MAKMRMVEKLKIETGLSNDATSPAGGWIPWKTFCRLWIDFSSLELLAKPNWTHRIWYMCNIYVLIILTTVTENLYEKVPFRRDGGLLVRHLTSLFLSYFKFYENGK